MALPDRARGSLGRALPPRLPPRTQAGPSARTSTSLHPDEVRVEQQVRNGGGAMPAFQGRLTDQRIKAVSEFVAKNANPNAKPPTKGGGTP